MFKKVIVIFNVVALACVSIAIMDDLKLFDIPLGGSYDIHINRYDAVISLLDDGTMAVNETWDMEYEGDYSVRFRDIEYDKFPTDYPLAYSEENIARFDKENYSFGIGRTSGQDTVTLNKGTSFTGDYDELGDKVACPSDASSLCESFFIERKMNDFNKDTIFNYNYQIHDVITEYSDVQEFNWQLFEYAENTVLEGSLTIKLPHPLVSIEDVSVYTPSFNDNIVSIQHDRIIIQFSDLTTREALAVRILLPKETFTHLNESAIFIDEDMNKEVIMAFENTNLESAGASINVENIFIYLLSVLLGNTLFFLGKAAYKRHLQATNYQLDTQYYKSPPSEHSPAMIGYIVNNNSFEGIETLSATVLDLIYKGYLSVEDTEFDEGYIRTDEQKDVDLVLTLDTSKDTSDLKDHELFLIQWYINELGDGSSVSMARVNGLVTNYEEAMLYTSKAKEFESKIRSQAYKENIMERGLKDEKRKVYNVLIFSVLVLAIQVSLSLYLKKVLFIPFALLFLSSFLFTIPVKKFRKKTEKWEKLTQEWLCYKENLKNMSILENAVVFDIEFFDYHLIYASIFGLTDLILDRLVERKDLANRIDFADRGNLSYYRRYSHTLCYGSSRNRLIAGQHIRSHQASQSTYSGSSGGFSSGSSFGGGGGGGRSR